jgi:hypothetical protein
MKVDWSKALGDGLRFGFHPKRWLQLFAVDAVFISLILYAIYFNLSDMIYIFSSLSAGADGFLILSLLKYIWIPVLIFAVWRLVRIWIDGAIIYQGWKTKDSEIGKSWRFACRKYPSLLLALLIITLVSGLVLIIPYIGFILAIVISWIFYFALQAIIIRNIGFYEGLEDSYRIFRKHPFEVIVIWLAILIVNIVIFGIFALPFAYLLLTNIFYLAQTTGLASLLLMLKEQVVFFVASGLILLIGISITTAFTLKAKAEFYLQLRKRFRIF